MAGKEQSFIEGVRLLLAVGSYVDYYTMYIGVSANSSGLRGDRREASGLYSERGDSMLHARLRLGRYGV